MSDNRVTSFKTCGRYGRSCAVGDAAARAGPWALTARPEPLEAVSAEQAMPMLMAWQDGERDAARPREGVEQEQRQVDEVLRAARCAVVVRVVDQPLAEPDRGELQREDLPEAPVVRRGADRRERGQVGEARPLLEDGEEGSRRGRPRTPSRLP